VVDNPVLEQVLATLRSSMECSVITLGARLGCWSALADAPDGLSAGELARACTIHHRYAREWLEAMGAAGLLTYAGGSFALAEGVREVLVDEESDLYLAPLLRQSSAAAASLRPLEQAYRSGDGLPWSHHDPDMTTQQAAATRGQLRRHLAGWVRRGLPSVAARLDEGGVVADIGCGYGWASVGLAEAFPAIRVQAYDLDAASVAGAKAVVESLDLADRISVVDRPLSTVGAYDLVLLAGMLHDVPDPVGLLSAARAARNDGGAVLVIDMRVADSYTAPAGEVDRLMYGFSTLICLPDSMSYTPTAATGTVMRASTLRHYAEQAGFDAVDELPIRHQTSRFYSLT